MAAQKEGIVIVTTLGNGGKEYSGQYAFDERSEVLIVFCEHGCKEVLLHDVSNPEPMAKLMLADIIKKMPKK
ncbi:MAG TPA: hypothetical protein VMV04_23480 [Thermodesulfobacteriota bacterium]|jgi:hypothetical protein|nr:hypothetical protein [Thermodesulfobacteriota bacterium]